MERHFEIGLPVQVVNEHWEGFRRQHGAGGINLEMEPAGGDSTRVRLLAEGVDGDVLDEMAHHFQHYLEARGELQLPLVGTLLSPGAPN
jgi:hypothetical protein